MHMDFLQKEHLFSLNLRNVVKKVVLCRCFIDKDMIASYHNKEKSSEGLKAQINTLKIFSCF